MIEQFKDCKTTKEALQLFNSIKNNLENLDGDNDQLQEVSTEFYKRCEMINGKIEDEKERASNRLAIGAIHKVKMLPNVIMEIIGTWVWVTGKTYNFREQIKEAGYTYSRSKNAWYFKTEDTPYRKYGKMTLEEIRDKHAA